MRIQAVLASFLLLFAGSALAQNGSLASSSTTTSSTTANSSTSPEFGKIETAPGFMYIRTNLNLTNSFTITNPTTGVTTTATGSNDFNCAGGGGTIAYNLSRMFGVAADLGGCKIFGNTIGLGNTLSGTQFTYLFGPRVSFRNNSPVTPFFDLGFGGDRFAVSCQNNAYRCLNRFGSNQYSSNAFALTVGGGFDLKVSHRVSLRLVQAEYMYTRFGNSCALAVCSNNNNQNSFRLKSGIVVAWGEGPGSNR
jgi:opacity protein-like surface antigen